MRPFEYHSWPLVGLNYAAVPRGKENPFAEKRAKALVWLQDNNVTFQFEADVNCLLLYIQDPKHMLMFKLKFGDVIAKDKL